MNGKAGRLPHTQKQLWHVWKQKSIKTTVCCWELSLAVLEHHMRLFVKSQLVKGVSTHDAASINNWSKRNSHSHLPGVAGSWRRWQYLFTGYHCRWELAIWIRYSKKWAEMELRVKKSRCSRSQIKVMGTVFLYFLLLGFHTSWVDANKRKNLYQVALLSTFYEGDHGGLIIQ